MPRSVAIAAILALLGTLLWTMVAAVLADVIFNASGLTALAVPPPTFLAIAAIALLLARAATDRPRDAAA